MLDAVIVLAFVAYSLAAGLRSRRIASESAEEYFLAGRTLPGWQAGISMAATQFAADTPLLVAGLVATGGIFLLWRLWVYGLAFLAMAFVFARTWRRAGVLTDAELTEIRYSGPAVLPLRALKAVYYGTFFNCVVLAMVLVAAVRIAEVFLPWHQWLPPAIFDPFAALVQWSGLRLTPGLGDLPAHVDAANQVLSILLVVGFTAMYSITGGLRAVVATDIAQFAIAMAGTVAYAAALAWQAGGVGAIATRITGLYGDARAGALLSFAPPMDDAGLAFLTIVAVQWLFQVNADGTGYLAQRAMACRSDRDAKVACLVFAWAQILARSLIWLVIAAALLVAYPLAPGNADPAQREMLFVVGLQEHLGPGFRGLLLVAMLAALASTVDTHLNWGASYWSNDLYRRLVCEAWLKRTPRPSEVVLVARLSTVVIIALALLVMSQLDSIQQAWQVSLLFGAGLGAVLVLRWLWERVNAWSEVGSVAVSLVLAPVLLRSGLGEWEQLLVMAAASTVVTVGAALAGPQTEPAVLDRFYARVAPVGWWPDTAARAGEPSEAPRRRAIRQAGWAVACSASLFLLLYALGSWLLPAPGAPEWAPWIAAAIGVGVVPIWWAPATD